jgi:hypothetical protein
MNADYSGAIEKFRAYVEWAKANNLYEKYGKEREKWIKELKSNINCFQGEYLKNLRNDFPLSALKRR